MSTYEIEYDDLNSLTSQCKAIQDTRAYLGDNWDTVIIHMTQLISAGTSMRGIEFNLSFAGIQGYPVWALVIYVIDRMSV
jgi:hypothetical protein